VRAEVIRVHLSQAGPHGGSPTFVVDVDLVGCRLRLAGRLDRSTVHLLHDAVSTLLRADGRVWVVDATHVTDCDRMAVRAIAAAYRRSIRHDRRLRLTGAPPALLRELTRLRLDHHLLDGDDGTAAVPDPRRPAGEPAATPPDPGRTATLHPPAWLPAPATAPATTG
jgi:anti-anti-sigma regulatory factor